MPSYFKSFDCRPTYGFVGEVGISKSVSIELAVSGDEVTLFRVNKGRTITKMVAVLVGSGSPSITWTVRVDDSRNATGTEIVTGGTVTTSVTTGTVVTVFNSSVLVADDWAWVEITAQSGTVEEFHLTVFLD